MAETKKPDKDDSKAPESKAASASENEGSGLPRVSQHELVSALHSALNYSGVNEGARLTVERWLEENADEESS